MSFVFEPNIWITGIVNGKMIIGRTLIFNNVQLVGLVDEYGNFGHFTYNKISNIKKLHIVKVDDLTPEKVLQLANNKPKSLKQRKKEYTQRVIQEFNVEKLSKTNKLQNFKVKKLERYDFN